MRFQRSLILLGLLAAVLVAGTARAQRLAWPDGVFYYEPASSVFGAEAAWVNPAGLSAFNAAELQFFADYEDDEFARSWGAVLCRERLATAYRRLDTPDGDVQEYLLASGFAVGQMHLGGSYRYLRTAPGYLKHKHTWNLAAMGATGSPLRWGMVLSNVNHARDDEGERTRTEMRYSLSYRLGRKWPTVSVDMMMSTGMRLADADYIYHLAWRSRSGVHLNGYIDSHGAFQVGIRFDLHKYFLAGKSLFSDDGKHRRTSLIFGASSLRHNSLIPSPARELTVGISGGVKENPGRPLLGKRRTPFAELIGQIYRAADDPTIASLSLSTKGLRLGFGRTQELRAALKHFQSRGKPVTIHLSYPGNLDYYLAATADRILMDPVAQINLIGLRAEQTFYGGTLAKLGVGVEMVAFGDYKAASETYSRSEPSRFNQEQVNALLDDLFDQFVRDIAADRGFHPDSLRNLIDNGPYTSAEAMDLGLVDGLSYRDEVGEQFGSYFPGISFRRYQADTVVNDGWPTSPRVAVVVAEGAVKFGSGQDHFSDQTSVTPALMNAGFAQAARDGAVEALVLRVNSPGGLALAGEEIHRTVSRARERRPLVVSMANQAASGAYYFAMPGERLFANPAAVTGSIGVYAGKPDLSGLYDKIDLGKYLYLRGRHAGLWTYTRGFTDDERARFRDQLEQFYGHFLDLVATSRGLSVDSVGNLAAGRVWTGRRALEIGLIDQTGGLHSAVEYAAEQGGLDDYRVVVYPRKQPFLELPGTSLFQLVTPYLLGRTAADGDDWPEIPSEGIYARLPYDLVIE